MGIRSIIRELLRPAQEEEVPVSGPSRTVEVAVPVFEFLDDTEHSLELRNAKAFARAQEATERARVVFLERAAGRPAVIEAIDFVEFDSNNPHTAFAYFAVDYHGGPIDGN